MKSRPVLFSAFILLGMLNGCAPAAQIDATAASTPAVQVQANTPAPTQYPNPTSPPLATPVPSPTATPLPTLAVGERILAYEIRNNMLTLRTPESAQTLTFPSDIVQVEAQGQNIRVTLADGTEKTLTWDQETSRWQEQAIEIYRDLTELDPSKEEEFAVIQKAVADAIAGGVFWDETEIKAKIEAGELKVVKDEKTGAIMVFTREALEYMAEHGQSLADSDFARILQTGYTINGAMDESKMDATLERMQGSPAGLQGLATRVWDQGGFLPLPPEWMTLAPKVDEQGKPQVVAVLTPGWVHETLYKFNISAWTKQYPTNEGRLFGDPVKNPGSKKKPVLAVVLSLDAASSEARVKRQKITPPYLTPYRWMKAVVDEGQIKLEDEYHTLTHQLEAAGDKLEWQELETYQTPGTAYKRMAQALTWKAFEEKRILAVNSKQGEFTGQTEIQTNVLGLNPEIVAEARKMLEAGKPVKEINQKLMELYKARQKEDPKSSGIWLAAGADGKPYMVAVVGGEYGLTPQQLANLQKAVAGLEAVDPGIIKFLSEQFGAKFIARKTMFVDVDNRVGTFSSNNYRDTIVAKFKSVKSVADFIIVLLAESGEIHVGKHMTSEGSFADKMSEYNNVGVFASQWTIDWLKLHGDGLIQKGVITQKELNDIVNLAKHNLEHYQNLP